MSHYKKFLSDKPMSENVIIVNNLSKKFGSFTAVDNISFSVAEGEIFGFLGANGAGKSTTIRILCGLLSPSSGSAVVAGYDVNHQAELVKTRIGYMSQKFSLYEDLTVKENIIFYGGIYGLSNAQIEERMGWIVEMTGLSGSENRLTRELAVGWKQRLALGCAVIHQPRIVFLDEPTSGVDPVFRKNFWELINQFSEQGTTIFVTTHYLDEAEYCNRLMLIHRGRIIAGGSPGELKEIYITNPILEIECDSALEVLEILQKEEWVIESSIFGTYLHIMVRDELEAKHKIKKILSEKSINLKRVDKITPGLEDVFISLIEKPEQSDRL